MNLSTPEKCLKEGQRTCEETASENSQLNKAKILICEKAASWEEKPSLVDNILNV